MGTGILVYCESDNGQPRKTALELLSKATSLGLGPVSAVAFGEIDSAKLAAHGASKVYVVKGGALARYSTTGACKALALAVEAAQPAYLLGSANPNTRDCFPRLAARLRAGLVVECTELRNDGGALVGRRPVYAGKALVDARARGALGIFSARPNSFPVGAPGGGTAEVVSLDLALGEGDLDTRC